MLDVYMILVGVCALHMLLFECLKSFRDTKPHTTCRFRVHYAVCRDVSGCTLPPIIMVQWKMGVSPI